jgi:hypothetical protein
MHKTKYGFINVFFVFCLFAGLAFLSPTANSSEQQVSYCKFYSLYDITSKKISKYIPENIDEIKQKDYIETLRWLTIPLDTNNKTSNISNLIDCLYKLTANANTLLDKLSILAKKNTFTKENRAYIKQLKRDISLIEKIFNFEVLDKIYRIYESICCAYEDKEKLLKTLVPEEYKSKLDKQNLEFDKDHLKLHTNQLRNKINLLDEKLTNLNIKIITSQ